MVQGLEIRRKPDIKISGFEDIKYREIGKSGIMTSVWYNFQHKDKIPFGNHIDDIEKDGCKMIKIIPDVFYSPANNDYKVSYQFFMDNRSFGIGGSIYSIDELTLEEVPRAIERLDVRAEEILKEIGLQLNVPKIKDSIAQLQDEITRIDNDIHALEGIMGVCGSVSSDDDTYFHPFHD